MVDRPPGELIERSPDRCSAGLLGRDFTATAPNEKWVGDMAEVPTDEGKLYQATVINLSPAGCWATPLVSRRRVGGTDRISLPGRHQVLVRRRRRVLSDVLVFS